MTENRYVDKAKVLADLRERQLHDRAAWADRTLPEVIDVQQNAGLLRMLGIDLTAAASGGLAPSNR